MIETMKLALEALEAFLRFAAIHHDGPDISDKYLAEDYAVEGFRKARQVLPALRTAIEQSESVEPVAFFDPQERGFYWARPMRFSGVPVTVRVEPISLYTTPPAAQRQWVGLTDEDFENAFQETYIMGDSDLQDFAKVIEAKLKEKNT